MNITFSHFVNYFLTPSLDMLLYIFFNLWHDFLTSSENTNFSLIDFCSERYFSQIFSYSVFHEKMFSIGCSVKGISYLSDSSKRDFFYRNLFEALRGTKFNMGRLFISLLILEHPTFRKLSFTLQKQ